MEKYYRSIAKIIKAEFEACDIIEHSGRKGASRERVLIKHLNKLLPEDYGIGFGEIHDSKGTKSGETDIILYNKSFTPLIYDDEATQIFPIECVYGVIEVKSTLKLDEITKFMEKIHTLRNCPRTVHKTHNEQLKKLGLVEEDGKAHDEFAPFGMIFSLDGPTLVNMTKKIEEKIKLVKKEHQKHLINCICVINRGIVTRVNIEGEKGAEKSVITPVANYKGKIGIGFYDLAEDWVSLFVAILFDVLASITMVQPPNFIKYIPIDRLETRTQGVLPIGEIK